MKTKNRLLACVLQTTKCKKIPWFSLIYTSQLVSDFSVSCKNASIKNKEEEKGTRKLAKKIPCGWSQSTIIKHSYAAFCPMQWRISDDIEHCFFNTFSPNIVLQHFFNLFFKIFFAIIIFATCFYKIFFATFLHIFYFWYRLMNMRQLHILFNSAKTWHVMWLFVDFSAFLWIYLSWA